MLNDQVIVITGGAGLLGTELVKAVATQNAVAVIADIDDKAGRTMQARLSLEFADNIDFVQMDITSQKSIAGAIEVLGKRYGRIDALVNNAYPRNRQYGQHFFDVTYDDFVENVGRNLGGYFLTSQCFARYFQQQRYGNIVNIASIYGVVAPSFEVYDNTPMTMPVEYAAIKAGVIHLTKYMAKYFKGMDIRVNAISPGGIFDHQPEAFLAAYRKECLNKGMLDAGDVSGTLVYLLSDMSRFVNGQNVVVDDGFTI